MPEEKKESPASKPALEKEKKTAGSKKLWWILGGSCCLFLLIFLVILSFAPFLLSFFTFSADTDVPLPALSVSQTPTATSSKPAATAKPTSTSYGETPACERLEMVSSVPIDINANNPGLKQDVDTHYYQVYGYTPSEVRNQLNECGAKSEGEAYDAYTSYYVNWAYNYNSVAGGCAIKDATVGIKVDFFYPKWDDPGNAQTGLAERWQNYMTNLIIHEEGHKDIATRGAETIYDSLSTLPLQATCDEAESAAYTSASSIFADYDNRNKAYDDETGHGATQGAVFP